MRRGGGRDEKEKREWVMKEEGTVAEASELLQNVWLPSCKISAWAGRRVRRRRGGWRRTGSH